MKKIVVPITDHDANCTTRYLVEWKLTGDAGYSSMIWTNDQIEINNVEDASVYDVRITRYCCNGSISAPLILSVDTTSTSPVLDAPANFTLSIDSPPVTGQLQAAWDIVANADSYHGQLSKLSDFSVIAVTFETIDPTITSTLVTLDSGDLYYGRVLARASGYADSDYSNTDSETAP